MRKVTTPEMRRECGAKRAEVVHIIRHLLRKGGYTDKDFALKKVGCCPANVSKTLTGMGHSAAVLDALREFGIPEEYLFDPRKAQPKKPQETLRETRVA